MANKDTKPAPVWDFRDMRDRFNKLTPEQQAKRERERLIRTPEDIKRFDASKRGRELSALRKSLSKLSDFELLHVVWPEVTRRRIDEIGRHAINPRGLYQAVFEGLGALIGHMPMTPLAQAIAAVGRGERVESKTELTNLRIKEIWNELYDFENWNWKSDAKESFGSSYAAELGVRLRRRVSKEAIEKALLRKSHSGRITDVVIAAGLKEIPENASSQGEHRRVIQDQISKLCKKPAR